MAHMIWPIYMIWQNRVVIPKKANLSSTWKNETLNGDYTYNGLTKDGDPHFKDSYQ